MKNEIIYYAVSPITGEELFHCPNRFSASVTLNDKGNTRYATITLSDKSPDTLFSFWRNSYNIKKAIDGDNIWQLKISKTTLMEFDKFIRRGQIGKAENQARGLIGAILLNMDKVYGVWSKTRNPL